MKTGEIRQVMIGRTQVRLMRLATPNHRPFKVTHWRNGQLRYREMFATFAEADACFDDQVRKVSIALANEVLGL